jgi:hypothetical protein
MNALVLQGRTPAGQLVPIRVDDLGRIEFSQVAATDQALPTQAITMAAGVVTSNPTKPTIIAHGLLSGSGAVLLTAAAAYREVEIRFANVDTVARTYTYALNATTPGAVDDTHTQAKASPLPVGYAAVERIPGLILGDVILGLCDSANKVSYTIWGVA